MIATTETIVASLLMLVPALPTSQAEHHADIIHQTSGDRDEQAALLVSLARESAGDWDVERCAVHGMGGEGAYQLGIGYQAFACAAPVIQARTALRALHEKGWPQPLKAFRGYLGATGHSKEALLRLSLWQVTRERLACSCCL